MATVGAVLGMWNEYMVRAVLETLERRSWLQGTGAAVSVVVIRELWFGVCVHEDKDGLGENFTLRAVIRFRNNTPGPREDGVTLDGLQVFLGRHHVRRQGCRSLRPFIFKLSSAQLQFARSLCRWYIISSSELSWHERSSLQR
jgi:hypothetical protein